MAVLLRGGADPRLAVVVANGLDPTLIPQTSCEVSRNHIRYRQILRDDQGAVKIDDDGCAVLSEWLTVDRSEPNRWYQP